MTIKTIVGVFEKMMKGSLLENLKNEEMAESVYSLVGELRDDTEVATSTILASMTEEQFVKLLLMIQKMSVSLGVAEGETQVLKADMSGELQGYTHTVVLAVIGELIQDEVL